MTSSPRTRLQPSATTEPVPVLASSGIVGSPAVRSGLGQSSSFPTPTPLVPRPSSLVPRPSSLVPRLSSLVQFNCPFDSPPSPVSSRPPSGCPSGCPSHSRLAGVLLC
ncbi:hypothetical protein TESG_05126 [Trichophyton tonsurans CBS 112818]|uniref:Uncharacterized protein n=1 Tax=Trichophyton tonsurans (strain CBS 112818) TaxID=647933 RepID=F2S2C6_TRIT1|nr:hypothetical protein TESG_05126 [Trichophyton tonsurans CBS 112818]